MSREILWQPSNEQCRSTKLWKFAENTAEIHQCAANDYQCLLNWSIAEPDAFYRALWNELDITGDMGDVAFVAGETMRDAKFFPGAKLNYTENLLREPDDRLAIIAHRDDGTRRTVTRRELHARVSRIVSALRAAGISSGDTIAAIVTNDLEAIEFYLASAAIGAIWASCSPDFGPAGASDRLTQVAPKILVAVPNYRYAEKNIDVSETINAVAEVSSVERLIILGELPENTEYCKPATALDDWIAPFNSSEIDYNRAPFDLPMVVLFSSGTTGKPKCIVHRAGGLLLQHKKEHALHCDINEGDRLFYFTTCGWMMWNWQISALALGATLVTYDGDPFFPEPARLIDLIDSEKITQFGTSAKYIDACSKAGLIPTKTHSLATLKGIFSTGSTLLPESFDYIYRDWKADLHLASISGGTDICACFVGGVPILPVRRGELQGAMLGIDVDALDDDGNSVQGAPGEFICRSPHVTMPVKFWDDPDGTRYRDAYFTRFDGVWAQGDFIEQCPDGGFIIHGRSDTTLNPGGVRIGTAEIYRQVETVEGVLEAIAVGQDANGDQRVVLFLRLREGTKLDNDLKKTIRARIRKGATPRHVPAEIVAVPDIPRTRSGKISEIAVRDTIHGRKLKNTTALANAECLSFYADWAKNSGHEDNA